MLEGLHTKLSGHLYYGIEVTSFKEDDIEYFITVLKASKEELNLEFFGDHKTFFNDKNKTLKACLIVNTEQVLSRELDQPQANIEQSIESLFPNVDLNNFYYQSHLHQSKQYLSIVRKKHIDTIVEKLQSHEIYVSKIGLGNTIVSCLEQFSNLKRFSTSNAEISLDKNLDIKKQSETILSKFDIQGIEVSNLHLLSFLGAVNEHQSIFEVDDNLGIISDSSTEEYKYYLIFYYGLRSAVVFLLMVLMINFFYFNSYYDYVNSNENSENKPLISSYNNLKSQVEQLDKLTTQILQNQSSSTSFLFNDIIKILPSNIQLSEIAFQPLKKKIKKDKPIELHESEIIIKGETENSESFAYWNNNLEQLDWVNKVVITEFDAVENSRNHNFEIKIQLKE